MMAEWTRSEVDVFAGLLLRFYRDTAVWGGLAIEVQERGDRLSVFCGSCGFAYEAGSSYLIGGGPTLADLIETALLACRPKGEGDCHDKSKENPT